MPSNCSVRKRIALVRTGGARPRAVGEDEDLVGAEALELRAGRLVFSPVSAAMTAVTEATPITMPIVVRIERTLFAQICPSARNALW